MRRPLRTALLLLALSLPAAAALADTYRVDLIVFSDRDLHGTEQPVPAVTPDLSRAVDPGDRLRLVANHIDLLSLGDFKLGWLWHRLAQSGQFTPLLRLAWAQTDPPAAQGPALHLHQGPSYPLVGTGAGGSIQQIDGSVALYGGQLLHINADLSYTYPGPDGLPVSWRLHELRRVKLKELHFLDGGGFGVLVEVNKLK